MNVLREQGLRAYERRAWDDAYQALSEADTAGMLEADDVERLALCAGLTGRESAAVEAFERLHRLRLDAGEVPRAARAAFWCAMRLLSLGEMARGSGWLARAQSHLEDQADSVEHGYLRLPRVFLFNAAGDYAGARAEAAAAADAGTRYGDRDLHALARSFEGRALIRSGEIAAGLALLDEAMLAVTSDELSPVVSGLIYCGVIAACQQSYALGRAREWTAALGRWCEGQPQLVAFAGACLIHRSEILQLGGAWPEAAEEARQASQRLSPTKDGEAGNAFYQQGELYRLRGSLAEAEQAYALAHERGRDPQPGLALLRLAQGRADLAAASTRRLLAATKTALQRTRFLPAHVEILLATGEVAEARLSADEIVKIAIDFNMETLSAIAEHARGAVTLAEGDAQGAIEPLQRAQEVWQRVGAPYLSARIRVVLARAYQALGDDDGAALERSYAKKIFEQVGAAPDLAALLASAHAPLPKQVPVKGQQGLSAREVEVLQLVATGDTNKQIAKRLCLSERTVERHVSNLFTKLNVTTRAAATAWAYEHGLAG